MELTGKQTLHVSQETVWAALNDPAILQQCIPGCDSFVANGDNRYDLVMTAAVGPIKAKFKGTLQLTDIQAPNAYALNFEGSGGSAGFGKGSANVKLSTSPEGTDLDYAVQAKVGGKLAQVGARLIDGVAKKMADDFFVRFKTLVEPSAPVAAASAADAATMPASSHAARQAPGWQRWAWVGGAIVAVLVIWLAGGRS